MLDFPPSPTLNERWPSPPVAGLPVWKWDGEKWVTDIGGVGGGGVSRDELDDAIAEGVIAPGSVIPFYLASAPLGWTKRTDHNDKVLRVTSGEGGIAGGTNSFSSVMAQTVVGNTTLSIAQIAAHNHFLSGAVGYSGDTHWTAFDVVGGGNLYYSISSGNNGGGGAHSHPILMDIQYVDLILAERDVGSGSGGGAFRIPEAPQDGTPYLRQDAAWAAYNGIEQVLHVRMVNNQSVPANAWWSVLWDTVDLDKQGGWAGYAYKPTKPGFYLFQWVLPTVEYWLLLKNTDAVDSSKSIAASRANQWLDSGSVISYMNGTTDFLRFVCYSTTGTLSAGANFFSAYKLPSVTPGGD